MRLVVADTGPLNYLVLIDAVDLLPRLFRHVLVPEAVCSELAHLDAPPAVRAFIAQRPDWLEMRADRDARDTNTILHEDDQLILDEGERAAIILAISIDADLILMDDRTGVAVARRHGLGVIGTLGVLDVAARRGFIDFTTAVQRLKRTNFRYPPEIIDSLLAQHRGKKV
jgi:predicted nucleic acid-binding protein